MDERLWVLDTEGTGRNPSETIELAMVEMVGLEFTGLRYVRRFKPVEPIHYYATKVHGITNDDVATCPAIGDHLDEIASLVSGHAICGHGVEAEYNALKMVLPEWEPTRAYDTLRMVKSIFPDLERHRLSSVGDHLDLSDAAAAATGGRPHGALYDAVLTGMVLQHVMAGLSVEDGNRMMRNAEIVEARRQREIGRARTEERRRRRRMLKGVRRP